MNHEVRPIKRNDYKPWLLYKHYAHRIPSISYAFGLYDTDKILQGVCTFGIPPAENVLLCCGEKYKENALELNRLIKNDGLEKNTQSYFVAQCFKLLPKPMIIISYSDPNYGHHGYIYQALNFYYTGFGGDTVECFWNNKPIHTRHIKKIDFFKRLKLNYDSRKTIMENFKIVGGIIKIIKPKYRYVYFIGNKYQKREMSKSLKWNILPYPKGDNIRYDTSYKPKTQGLLF